MILYRKGWVNLKNQQFLQSYTIKEVSKQIQIPSGTIRQWEKDLQGLLFIPRTKQGARFYTEKEIALLVKVKHMRDKNLSKEIIRELLQIHLNQSVYENQFDISETALTTISENTPFNENITNVIDDFKYTLITEIKEEIRNGIRREVLDEVKKEISKSSLHTVKSLSDSIYKSSEKTKDEINVLSGQIASSSKSTSETIGTLSHTIAKATEHTSKKIKNLESKIARTSQHTSETVEALSMNIVKASEHTYETIATLSNSIASASEHTFETIDALSNSIANISEHTHKTVKALANNIEKGANYSSVRVNNLENSVENLSKELLENINTDRQYYVETIHSIRDQFREDIRQRENDFQEMVISFRDAAAVKEQEQKWWEFWKRNW
ncbi:MAG: MerR family transcriptional regulator [Bacillota bacterium]|nr:MerR family transcriptional regulator [Bacillota bacterium]